MLRRFDLDSYQEKCSARTATLTQNPSLSRELAFPASQTYGFVIVPTPLSEKGYRVRRSKKRKFVISLDIN